MKYEFKKIAAAFSLAAVMASQMLSFSAAAAANRYAFDCYFYYKGIYYSRNVDATNAAGGNAGAAEVVLNDNLPKKLVEKWLDPSTGRLFDSEEEAEVHYSVNNAQLVWVDPSYKPESETSDENEKKNDDNKKEDTSKEENKKPSANVKTEVSAVKRGTPYISGNKSRSGWQNISKKLISSKNGTYKIEMNGCETADKSVFKAIKGKAVTVSFVFENGYTWTVKGENVTKAADINMSVIEGAADIPQSLSEKAAGGGNASFFTISDTDAAFGTKASVKVMLGKENAKLSAVVYRYDAEKRSLKKICRTTVKRAGGCTFTAKQGGEYIIVIG